MLHLVLCFTVWTIISTYLGWRLIARQSVAGVPPVIGTVEGAIALWCIPTFKTPPSNTLLELYLFHRKLPTQMYGSADGSNV